MNDTVLGALIAGLCCIITAIVSGIISEISNRYNNQREQEKVRESLKEEKRHEYFKRRQETYHEFLAYFNTHIFFNSSSTSLEFQEMTQGQTFGKHLEYKEILEKQVHNFASMRLYGSAEINMDMNKLLELLKTLHLNGDITDENYKQCQHLLAVMAAKMRNEIAFYIHLNDEFEI